MVADPSAMAAGAPTEAEVDRWAALRAISLPVAMIGIDATILNVALPSIAHALDTTAAQLVWVNSAYILIFGSTILLSGNLADKYGRKTILMAGMTVFIVGSVLSGLSTQPVELIFARAIQGLGGGMIAPSTLSLITNIFLDPRERAKAIGTWGGMSAIGLAAGPILGGLLLTFFYWGSVFFINVPVVLVGLYMVWRHVPSSKAPSAPPIDFAGAALSLVGLVLVFYYLIDAPEVGITNPQVVVPLLVGVVLLFGFVFWELRVEHPLLDLRLFLRPPFYSGVIAIAIAFFALMGLMYDLTLYLQDVRGLDPLKAGFALLPIALMLMVGSPAAPRLVERAGMRAVVVAGLLLVGAGMGLFFFLQTDSRYFLTIAGMTLVGLGVALVTAPASNAIMGSVPRQQAGMGSSTNATMRQIAASLGIAVIGGVTQAIYVSQLDASGALTGLSSQAVTTATGSISGAVQVASQAGAKGATLLTAAGSAFVDGMHVAMLITLGAALIGALIAAFAIPTEAPAPEEAAAAAV